MADTLLPCPFCGAKPTMVEWTASAPEIRCDPCGIVMDGLRAEVIGAWNRRSALASRPAEMDDSQLRNVAQFLLDRYDELRNKKGAPSTAEFELLRLALAPSHTTNKEKG